MGGPNKHTGAKGEAVKPSSAPSGLTEAPEYMLAKACQISWRVDNFKLFGWRAAKGNAWQYALFDVHADQGENENVANSHPNEFTSMFKDMWQWAEGVYESQQSETRCATSGDIDAVV